MPAPIPRAGTCQALHCPHGGAQGRRRCIPPRRRSCRPLAPTAVPPTLPAQPLMALLNTRNLLLFNALFSLAVLVNLMG